MTTESQRLRTPPPRSREYQDLLIRHAPVLSIAAFFVIICLVFALGTTLIHPEPWDVTPYLNTWSSPVIWLMLGGFFMAEGLSRTGLDRYLFAAAPCNSPASGSPRPSRPRPRPTNLSYTTRRTRPSPNAERTPSAPWRSTDS